MSLIKRISTSLYAKIDRVVGEIENHDALIQATIADQRKKLAAAKVQLTRLQNHQTRVEQQLEKLRGDEGRWGERALKAAAEDESRALACMEHRRRVGEQICQLEQAREQYRQAAEKMGADVARCDDEVKEMSRRHALMRARQSSAEALGSVAQAGTPRLDELAGSFDRWEMKIAQNEIEAEMAGELSGDGFGEVDALEQEYLSEERTEALRDELAALMAEEKRDEQH